MVYPFNLQKTVSLPFNSNAKTLKVVRHFSSKAQLMTFDHVRETFLYADKIAGCAVLGNDMFSSKQLCNGGVNSH